MNLYDILLTIQYITVSVLFVEILIVFLGWKNSIHSYLLLTCITTFISNVGYLMQMQAVTQEAFITALKLSYAGRVWIVFTCFLFTAKICKKKLPRVAVYLLILVHVSIFASVLTIGSNDLYYRSYSFEPGPSFALFHRENGIMHDLFSVFNLVFVVVGLVWIVKAILKEKNRISKQRYKMIFMAFGVQILCFAIHFAGIFSAYYDVTMMGALFGTLFILVGIFRYDLLGTREIAREFAIDRISEGIIVVDNEGRIQYYNEPVTKLYPEFNAFYSMKPSAGDNAGTPYDILASIRDAVEGGETLKVGDRIFTPEENDLVYKGESYGKLYALVDATEHYQYMDELQKQRDIADSANEAKSRFLASMSHEIRTPINAVLGMDEMILREASEAPIRSYAADIMSAGKTLLSLINDILDLSKVEEGKMEIICVQYDLSSLINDLNNMIRERAGKKGLKFNVNVDKEIPHLLYGDEIRIRQCAMNLLTNAVKYTEKGDVTLDVSYEKGEEDHIFLKITVTDTGIGMKAEDMENLFSPYKRIEEERNRTIEGTGLGMSITRQLLELMGSSLEVKSEYGRGSVFSFSVDQKVVSFEKIGDITSRFKDMAERDYEYHELFHAGDAKILVVDDTEMNLTVIESLLKKTGIGIDTCLSGKEALAVADEKAYDVIFIDHMMPEMDGLETLKHIRESGKNKDVPAVALTANAVSGAREMYLQAGFTDCLFKPVDGEKLERMLLSLLPADKIKEPSGDLSFTPPEALEGLGELESIEDIDTKAGLANCGSEEGYKSVLSVFHKTTGSKAEEIEDLFKKADYENFTIKVHALKSSARIIGANVLSELARSLEDAGKRGDKDFIGLHTDRLLDMYRSLGEKISGINAKEGDLPAIGDKALKEAYQTMTEIAGSMDFGLMEDLLKSLRGYDLPEADRQRVTKIESCLNELDWDGIVRLAEEAQ